MTTITEKASTRTLDAITFEVLRRSFEYAPERMSQVLQKASFSPIIYDMVDYSNAIFDANLDLIGQTANCPVHIAAMQFSAEASLGVYPLDGLKPDDIVVLNDPYQGGTHTPDVTMTMPVYHDGALLAIAVSRAHWTDVGGNFDTHVAGEGLRLPPLMLMEGGVLNEDLVRVIKNCTRTPEYIEGDVQAQIGALRAGRDEIVRLADRYGADVVRQGMREILDYTQEMTAAALSRIPDGVYEAEDFVDSDGFSDRRVFVRVKLKVDGERVTVDLTDSDDEVMGPINSPYANTASAVYYALKFFLSRESPPNAGLYRQIDLEIREGSWLNPAWPAPTIGCTTSASSKICAAIWLALEKAIPDQIVAPTCSEANWFTATAVDPRTGETSVFSDLPAGGWGGTPYADGMQVTMDPLGNCQNLPAETAEVLFPVRYRSFEMITDSGGPGLHRGGCGVRAEIEFLGRGQLITMETSRTREGTPGVCGGGRSSLQRQLRRKADGRIETIGGTAEDGTWMPQMLGGVGFEPGDSFIFESCGGGGWGDPRTRDPEAVARDVRNEFVSREAAESSYGVALTSGGEIDVSATEELRR